MTQHWPAPLWPTPPVVVGLDHTPAGSAALRWAVGEALHRGARVVAVQVYDVDARADLAQVIDHDEDRTRLRILAHCQILDVLGVDLADACVVFSQRDGAVAERLSEASRGAGLLVVGTPSSDRSSAVLRQLEARAACPVVVIDEGGSVRPSSGEQNVA